ncbi:peptidoglycan DD-metalloendopeptidase family protein [Nitrincola nitratireducens]|uniref:Murein hydrolase activator NlpD n=1 Tax=Nitrincola nitratireducens TaxID=1229521 RepID=W9V7J3_9GAMM|nr:peptidoglycan DD-metalloendopeptidase family protein [Nitrincola nitratireducens]EXJ12067.1 Murein hydrolase activator NlpD precursor [Nitrincola nitratireducens]
MGKRLGALSFVLMFALLAGCGRGFAPVTDQSLGARGAANTQTSSRPAPLANPGTYTVKQGDTLYSISWRYGLDYREVARWNSIDQRYRIYPGQVLRLTNTGSSTTQVAASAPARQAAPVASTASRPAAPATQTSSGNASPRTASAQQPPVQTPPSAPPPQTTASTATSTTAASSASAATSTAGGVRWQWPASGNIIRRFSDREGGNKGVDIDGKMGDPILAAADGRVVYAGSGLLGYGNLVIINHNQQFLSAYAHNSRILVSENDTVKAGSKIAEMGNSGTDRVQLHFEIRRDGKPVDPLTYLPRR